MNSSECVVVIDPGHAEKDPGAIGPAGNYEKDINLDVALLLGAKLKAEGITVVYTRTSDIVPWDSTNQNVDLSARVKIANNVMVQYKDKNIIFISIHSNSGSAKASGMEIYTTKGITNSDALAEEIIKAWSGVIRKDLSDGDGDKEANYYVLAKTNMPSVLIELGFISNPEEEQRLINNSFQMSITEFIANGICSYFKIERKSNMNNWKQDIMTKAHKLGLISATDHNPDDISTKWFVLQVGINILKIIGKGER